MVDSRDVVVLVTAALAVTLSGEPRAWRVLRVAVTIAHEAGHALVAVLSGRRLTGVRLHSDTSGVTVSRGPRRGPGMVLTAAAGYPAPSLLGLAAAAMVAADLVRPLLWAATALLLVLLVLVRNAFGVLAVLVVGAVTAGTAVYGGPTVTLGVAGGVTWLLLVGGLRAVVELHRVHRRGARGSDADQLADLTRLPAALWVAVFWALAVAAVVAGGYLLLPGRA